MKDYENFSKEYGVNNRSILLDALYSDVTEQIPQDVMRNACDFRRVLIKDTLFRNPLLLRQQHFYIRGA